MTGEAMLATDEELLAELDGVNTDGMVYKVGGKYRLGKTGIIEAVNLLNWARRSAIRISNQPPIVSRGDGWIDVMVYAEDTMNGGGAWGAKHQPTADVQHPLENALGKAQRNAMSLLIPQDFIAKMILQITGATPAAVSEVRRLQREEPRREQPPRPAATADATVGFNYEGWRIYMTSNLVPAHKRTVEEVQAVLNSWDESTGVPGSGRQVLGMLTDGAYLNVADTPAALVDKLGQMTKSRTISPAARKVVLEAALRWEAERKQGT
jgi:hypothetical protein